MGESLADWGHGRGQVGCEERDISFEADHAEKIGRKWKRIKLRDLANAEMQGRVLGVLDQVK